MAVVVSQVYQEWFDYLFEKLSPQEILAFAPSEAAQSRALALTERNKEGVLSPEEREELAQMMEFDLIMGILKARAVRALRDS